MGLKFFTADFENIGKQESLRLDAGYRYFFDVQKATVYNFDKLIQLKYVLKELPARKVKKGNLENAEYLVDLGNVEKRFNNLINLARVDKVGSDKRVLQGGDIVIPKIQPQTGKIFLNLKREKYIGSTEFLEYLVSKNYNPIFLYYLINSADFLANLAKLESGKTHRRVNAIDLLKIKIPLISAIQQEQVSIKIEKIEKNIKQFKKQVLATQDIINKVFARDFQFDLQKFEQLKSDRYFDIQLSSVNTPLARSTVVQNKRSSNFLKSFLSKDSIFLKDILLKPIERGVQPEYTEEGVKVIKTLNIQGGKVILDEAEFVTMKFLQDNEKAAIERNDLLLTSTGMGRGKFALHNEEEICFADSHVSIMRFDQERFLPNFLNYYCQSFFGTEQLKYIEVHIKGTPEIYSLQLNYFQIPNISRDKQKEIVDEIKAELDKREAIENEIEAERSKIDKIIEEAVK